MIQELYLDNKGLIIKEKWEGLIISIRAGVKEDLGNKDEAIRQISKTIVKAVRERVPKGKKFGVMLSGGVDSSLIAFVLKNEGFDFTCYAVGFKDGNTKIPDDIEAAAAAGKVMGLKLKTKVLDFSSAESIIRKTVKLLGPGLNNVVNVGVGGVVVACTEMAKEDHVEFLFSGLGSEEVFAGYDRHRKALDRQEECWNGLMGMYERDLLRDAAIATGSKIAFLTPFLDEELIRTAMSIPAKLKVSDEFTKLILRESAEKMGLPKEIAWRRKKAAQYGSRLDRAIDKLAGKKGFLFKKDYLKSLE